MAAGAAIGAKRCLAVARGLVVPWWSGDGPAVGPVCEPEGDEPPEVDGGDAVGEPELVAVDAAVAEPPAAAHEPGDAALDHGPVLSVEVGEGVGGGEAAGGSEQPVVGVQGDDPPPGGGRASGP